MKPSLRFRGPSPVLLAIVHMLVFAAGLVSAAALRHGAAYVTPFAPAEQVRQFVSQSPAAMRVGSFFVFGSAVPFGLFAVTMVSLLRFLRVRAAGTNIALFGGLAAAISLFLSGIAGWILSVPDVVVSTPAVIAINFLNFLCGGPLYSVGFGLLAAGISITSHFMRLLPRWVNIFGVLLAITGELSWFCLLSGAANFFIPITRFVGFVWMLLAAVFLTRHSKRGLPAESA